MGPISGGQIYWGIFDIESYALLIYMIAQQCDFGCGRLCTAFGGCHLYNNHITDDIVYEQLTRKPKNLPTLRLSRQPEASLGYDANDFEFEGYQPPSAYSRTYCHLVVFRLLANKWLISKGEGTA